MDVTERDTEQTRAIRLIQVQNKLHKSGHNAWKKQETMGHEFPEHIEQCLQCFVIQPVETLSTSAISKRLLE